jgi:hypothetical protein
MPSHGMLQEMKTMQNFLNERFQQELFNEQQERFGRFDRARADLKHKTLKSYTFAVIGQKEFDRLKDENLVFEMKPDKVKIKSMLLRMRLTIIWSLSIARTINGCLSHQICLVVQISNRIDLQLTAARFVPSQCQS